MRLATVIERYGSDLHAQFGKRLLPGHLYAMAAIARCRTPLCGEMQARCHECDHQARFPLACGHRHCPQCQNHENEQWLSRQRNKLLNVPYFMVTFTLPAELRTVAWQHQRRAYDALFRVAWSTLRSFGLNDRGLRGQIGATAVLHTHTRRLDYHPHLHVIVPGGGLDPGQRLWRRAKKSFLFPEEALAKVFRARMLQAFSTLGIRLPKGITPRWVVDCLPLGCGDPALLYLGRYLYRGVIREDDILADSGGQVTFRYREGGSGRMKTRTLPGADFLWLVLQHVMPRRFRRVRDYGFLHGNAREKLQRIQCLLRIQVPVPSRSIRPPLVCRSCGQPIVFSVILRAMDSSIMAAAPG